MSERGARSPHDERGAIMVLFAISLPAILLFASFVVDASNWWEHQKHLQMQADAAALAAASQFAVPCTTVNNTAIRAEALKYSGIGGSRYNAQVGNAPPERLHMAINSKTYPLQTSPVDPTVVEGEPCSTAMVDVKLTESDVPWLLGVADTFGIGGADFINAHARVSVVKVESLEGALPIGVPDVDPKSGKVQFIDEDTDAVLGSAEMTRVGVFNGFSKWEVPASNAIPVTIKKGVRNIGMRVILSGGNSLTCGEPLVSCYDGGSADGLRHVHGWTDESTGNDPVAKKMELSAIDLVKCSAYFTYSDTTCLTKLSAEVDFGSTAPVTALGATVKAVAKNKTYDLALVAGRWETLIPVDPGDGPVPITLEWKVQRTKGGGRCRQDCDGSFGVVQRAFAGTDARSGPIRIAQVYENGTLPVTSLQQCRTGQAEAECTYNLTVDIGLLGSLADAATATAPLVGLRVTGGSQNQSLDCDPDIPNLKDELIAACQDTYALNKSAPCPATSTILWASAQPWKCVALQTGNATGQVAAGMNKRILGDEQPKNCTAPNRWHTDFPLFNPEDPRLILVMLTPYGSFSGAGSGTVPVTNFGTFYVTGWTANGAFSSPCPEFGLLDPQGDEVEGSGEAGYIYGRFVKSIRLLPGGGGNVKCDFASFGACTAVLTD